MQLKAKRLWIRPFSAIDLYDMHEYCTQEGVGINAGWAPHSSLAESTVILDDWIAKGRRHAIVLRETGKVIGHISIDPDSEEDRTDTRELGCALNLRYHRKGLMTEAITAVMAYLFDAGNMQYLWACCFQSNLASKGMIEKCGFRFVQEGSYHSASLCKTFSSYEYRISKEEWLLHTNIGR